MPIRETPKRLQSWLRTSPFAAPQSGVNDAYEYGDLLISESHKVSELGKTRDDIGGEFLVIKRELNEQCLPGSSGVPLTHETFSGGLGPSYVWAYDGDFFAYKSNVSRVDYPDVSPTSDFELDVWGASAIANTIPTNPLAGLSTFLGELHEGLPRLFGADFFKSRIGLARSAGSEYLNYEFGWKPLVNDLRKFAHSVKFADELIARYVQNSGKRLKRRFEVQLVDDSSVEYQGLCNTAPVVDSYIYAGTHYQGPRYLTTTTKHRRWFSGCYTYYLEPYRNDKSNFKRNSQIANRLLGTRITPEVVWNLTPWSWAADWFGNFGDVIHNISAFASDGLVMPYAYVMDEKSVTHSYALHDIQFASQPEFNGVFYQDFTTTVKKRRRANPFGFGLLYEGLTPRQKAIAGSLGLTRGRGKR